MRVIRWIVWLVLIASVRFGQVKWEQSVVASHLNEWYPLRLDMVEDAGRLTLHSEKNSRGFALIRRMPARRCISIDAEIKVFRRLCKSGWNYAGITLYQDDANFWMLALVEGPDGTHSVDFLENHAGVWQAQNAADTALKREGTVSFPWVAGESYKLSLSICKGFVRAQVADTEGDHVINKAFFQLTDVPAIRYGRPGVILNGSDAAVCNVRVGSSLAPPVPIGINLQHGSLGRLALLDDDLPGHDRAANSCLADALTERGFGVTLLSAEQLVAPDLLTADIFDIVVVPQCQSIPVQAGEILTQFAGGGGDLIFLGGPMSRESLLKVGECWLDKAGQRALYKDVVPAFRPFEIGPDFDVSAWRRSSPGDSRSSSFRVVNEGLDGTACLRMDIPELAGWDVRNSPKIPALFAKGDNLFTFLAKGCERTSQLAVEMMEEDGSRWIATASLTSEWQRVGLRLVDFKYWRDSSVKNRGEKGDQLNPQVAVHLGFGLSSSHTPTVPSGKHTLWIADVGSALDPLSAASHISDSSSVYIETISPFYKVHVMSGDLSVQVLKEAFTETSPAVMQSVHPQSVVCAIPRMLGEGFERNAPWRFIPLATASRSDGKTSGVCEWLLLNKRPLSNGQAVAGFGYTDPAVWSSPIVIDRIVQVAVGMRGGMFFAEAGTEHFAYWPGEPIRIGAHIRAFGKEPREATVECDIRRGDQVLWHKRFQQKFEKGMAKIEVVWQPPAEAAEYAIEFRLIDADGDVADVIRHGFAVLDTSRAPKASFITARDGDFWLEGKKWYPVGINYWPLYISGMQKEDYWAGWMRDGYYAPALVERDMNLMADMGINMLSIQTPPVGEYRNLLHVLRLCKKYGMHANLFMGQASPLAFRETELKEYLETARISDNPTVFAYDTIWEPGNHVFKNDAARAKWDAQWRAWINEQYGSVSNAEKNWSYKARRNSAGDVISPPDKHFREDGEWRIMMAAYRRFMDNLTSRKWNKASRKLRELDPNHLISFRQGNTLPYDFALTGPVKHIDFICPEGYSIRNTDEGEDAIGFITRYVHHTTGGKPIIWSEFGKSVWDRVQMKWKQSAIVEQGLYSERFYRTALAAGANGTAPWWWPGGYRVGEGSDFGIVEPDLTERPAAQLIREYAPRFKQSREKPQADTWMTYDRDAHAGGYWRAALHEGGEAYHRAVTQGRMLGIRTLGTGHDSVTVPLTAVGNLPCDGTNPPKYLDAEFNLLQVMDVTGVWRDVADGSEIQVATGKSVRIRASLANIQEAAWLPPSEAGDSAGGVALVARVAGKEVSCYPLKRRTSYLADAEFGELMFPQIEKDTLLSLRLEARGRTPFGESRIFTLHL
jgi:hypothetical protein